MKYNGPSKPSEHDLCTGRIAGTNLVVSRRRITEGSIVENYFRLTGSSLFQWIHSKIDPR